MIVSLSSECVTVKVIYFYLFTEVLKSYLYNGEYNKN